MTINPRFQPVSTEFEVLATRNTRSSPNSCLYGLALVELAGSGRRWRPYFNAYPGRRIGGFHYIPHGSHEPIGLSLIAGVDRNCVGRASSKAACFSASIKPPSNRFNGHDHEMIQDISA